MVRKIARTGENEAINIAESIKVARYATKASARYENDR